MAGGRWKLLRAAFTLAVVLLAVSPVHRALAQGEETVSPELAGLDRALAHWDRKALGALAGAEQTALAALAAGCLALLDGDLETVERLGREAAASEDEAVRSRGEWLVDTAVSWRSVLSNTVALGDEDFSLRVPADQREWGERILPYARHLVTTSRAEVGLTDAVRMRVVVLPDTDSLSRVAGIPAARLAGSGTVATTLLERIFLLSPGAFPNGYPWHVVLSHEAVHEACQRRFPGKLPHALEEGLATLLEERAAYGRWRTYTMMERAHLFIAGQEGLLLSAEELDAPFWQLTDGLRARLAFLQSLAGALVIQHKGTDGAVQAFFDGLAQPGTDWLAALEQTTRLNEKSFRSRLEKRWTTMASREYLPSFIYSDGSEWLSEKGRRAVKEARKTVALGDLLWGRRHYAAALRMYDRVAHELQTTPEMIWRWSRLLLELSRAEEALERVEATLVRHPRDARAQYAAALVYKALGQTEKADQASREAWLLNPFAEQTGALYTGNPLDALSGREKTTP